MQDHVRLGALRDTGPRSRPGGRLVTVEEEYVGTSTSRRGRRQQAGQARAQDYDISHEAPRRTSARPTDRQQGTLSMPVTPWPPSRSLLSPNEAVVSLMICLTSRPG